MKNKGQLFTNLAAIAAAILLLQSLYFKFTGAAVSMHIFGQLGVEPYGRIFTGTLELVSGIMLLIPAVRIWGALLTAGIMGGAIVSHLFILGIEVQGDGGQLFAMAVIILALSAWVAFYDRERALKLIPFLR